MPITKAAKKSIRQSERRKNRNLEWKKKLKQLLKELRDLIFEKKRKEAESLLPQIYKILDKSVKSGIIKKGTADRRKSRFRKAINKLS
jgi:small subunit ribosomal protein S20